MPISIAICTRNNATALTDTLHHLLRQPLEKLNVVELLVVDNGSTDATPAVVRGIRSTVPIRFLFEPQPGVARARNRVLREFAGDVLVSIDDDIRVCDCWLEALVAPVVNRRADGAMGFTSLPDYVTTSGLPEQLHYFFARFDHGAVANGVPKWIATSNFCIARAALTADLTFDEELGPGASGFCEDTLFYEQLKVLGRRIVSVPEARVEHRFNPKRLERQAVYRMAGSMGKSEAYVDYHWKQVKSEGIATRRKLAGLRYGKAFLRSGEWAAGKARKTRADVDVPLWYALHARGYWQQMAEEVKRKRNYAHPDILKRTTGIAGYATQEKRPLTEIVASE